MTILDQFNMKTQKNISTDIFAPMYHTIEEMKNAEKS